MNPSVIQNWCQMQTLSMFMPAHKFKQSKRPSNDSFVKL